MSEGDIIWIKESLRRIEEQIAFGDEHCRERHALIDRELGALSVKVSIISAVAGLVSGGVFAAIQMIFRR